MRKILTRAAVRRVDAATVENGIAGIDLMENAAAAFVRRFKKIYHQGVVTIICGSGNNGGDGLAIARLLYAEGYDVDVFVLQSERYSEDFETNKARLQDRKLAPRVIQSAAELPEVNDGVIIDALFGTGLNKPVTEPAAGVIQWMNKQPVLRVSVDVPSGMAEQPLAVADLMVNADYVIAFQLYRKELLMQRDGYNPIAVFFEDIGLDEKAIESELTSNYLIEENDVRKILKTRRLFDHKWTYGHALIVAGSRRTLGAALLATGACLRSGCGLVTTHTVRSGATAVNTLFPEAMFSPDAHDEMITNVDVHERFNAIGIGCGIGRSAETGTALVDVLTKSKLPCVIDADALNLLSSHHSWKSLITPGSILTPHQKEFDRLAGEQPNDDERMQHQIEMAVQTKSVVVLKGAFTRVALPDGRCFFNSTGTPALATAGTGDVLTGLITGLVARGYDAANAALAGVYLHGLAGQLASEKNGIECVKATDVIEMLPQAFKQLY